jgi:hypothetical protein
MKNPDRYRDWKPKRKEKTFKIVGKSFKNRLCAAKYPPALL